MRLASPAALVDINRLGGELGFITPTTVDGNTTVRVGALTRHADLARSAAAFDVLPLLRQATAHVAHATIRNRGTTVGSIVHAIVAEPPEMPAVLALLGGSVS